MHVCDTARPRDAHASKNETHKNISQKWLTKETDSQKCSTKINCKIRLTKMFHKKDTQNETHKNISQKWFTKETDSQNVPQKEYSKWDSQKWEPQKYLSKMIHKIRLTKIFHKMRPTKIFHKMRLTKMFHKKDTQNETRKKYFTKMI